VGLKVPPSGNLDGRSCAQVLVTRYQRTLSGYGSGPLKTIGLMVLEILLKIAHVEAPQRVDFLVSSAGVRKG
jgi:hypothetical protein